MIKKHKFFRKIIVSFTLLSLLILNPKINKDKSVSDLSKENPLKVHLCEKVNLLDNYGTNIWNSGFNPIDKNNVSVQFLDNFDRILKDEQRITSVQSRYIIFIGDEEKMQSGKKKEYRPRRSKLQTMPKFLQEERNWKLNELLFRIDLDDFNICKNE